MTRPHARWNRLLLGGLLLAAFCSAGEAQRRPPGQELLCTEKLSSIDAFRDVLTEAERERLSLARKMLHGNYERVEYVGAVFRQAAGQLFARVRANLADLDTSGTTAALIYATQSTEIGTVICSWLVTASDFNSNIVKQPDTSLPKMVQDGLGVTVRAASRSPVRRHVPEAAATADTSGAPPVTAGDALERTADALLSRELRQKLIDGRIRRLLVLAGSDLGTVPFAALPVVQDKPLVGFASVVILPDVSALVSPQPIAARNFSGTKLIVGDPDLTGDRVWTMPALPAAGAEATDVAQRFHTSALTGKSASRAAVVARLKSPKIDLAYFATHGVADEIDPMDGSFLALSGGPLLARDIKRLKLASKPLVVMSACQTGLGKIFRGGVFGLARAWFFAGAPQVVMSLWSVDDEATKALMVAFMSKVAEGIAPERALQDAMLATRVQYSDAVLWAGFAVYGQPTRI